MPRLERIESQDTAPPPQQAAVLPDRKTVTPLPADDNGKRKIPLGAGGNKQSSSNTQQKKKAKTQKQKKEKDPNRPKKSAMPTIFGKRELVTICHPTTLA